VAEQQKQLCGGGGKPEIDFVEEKTGK